MLSFFFFWVTHCVWIFFTQFSLAQFFCTSDPTINMKSFPLFLLITGRIWCFRRNLHGRKETTQWTRGAFQDAGKGIFGNHGGEKNCEREGWSCWERTESENTSSETNTVSLASTQGKKTAQQKEEGKERKEREEKWREEEEKIIFCCKGLNKPRWRCHRNVVKKARAKLNWEFKRVRNLGDPCTHSAWNGTFWTLSVKIQLYDDG